MPASDLDPPVAEPDRAGPGSRSQAELRWVSVLFVDLVGFTSWSDGRDPEEARELLSGYFDVARTVVSRYGGVVEKFIGDAVMAVWGAPVAREDDAERAVRAAMEVVSAVAEFGRRCGAEGLMARAGVTTGQVAAWSSPGEGLVSGDRVNTAARVQSVAGPGQVLVDETTRVASQAAIMFASAGEHAVKGKAEPLSLWRALRVVANVGGVQRVDGLEAGFVGRARELALVKELFHAALEQRRTRFLLVAGAAGVGKSRLGWEFEKYVDGLAATVWWHHGRCLSYGEGLPFRALAEMVRQRFDIAEDESAEVAASRLAERLPTWVPDPEERAFVSRRLSVLVGAEDADLGREELFAGWRLFLERLAGSGPVVWVVEDLQWADDGLLSFLEYLLEWSVDLPLFVVGLARSELTERRPGWLSDRRNVTSLHLEPLSRPLLESLLDDLVPGMPDGPRTTIAERAEGIPLFAVETIRSLVDKDVVVPQEGVYRLVGDIGEVAVPATLTSLLLSRLDGLPVTEREVVKGLAVLGASFPRTAADAVAEGGTARIDECLRSLVRKEVLSVRSDPLSPDRGQYAFTQTMLRSVAYETLTKRERKTRHLAAARHLRSVFPEDGEDVAEAIAVHYQAAFDSEPRDPDADEIRDQAVDAFSRAGARAGILGSPDVAERHFRTAANLTTDEGRVTRLTEQAGGMAEQAGRLSDALVLLESAAAADAAAGRHLDAARLEARIGACLARLGKAEEAVERLQSAVRGLDDDAGAPELADLHGALGRSLTFLQRLDEASSHIERSLSLAAAHDLPRVLSMGLGSKALVLGMSNRIVESVGVLSTAVDVAHRGGYVREEATHRINLGDVLLNADLSGADVEFEKALTLLRRLGDQDGQAFCLGNMASASYYRGRWDEARAIAQQAVELAPPGPVKCFIRWPLVVVYSARGEVDPAQRELTHLETLSESSDDWQDFAAISVARAAVATARGDLPSALAAASAGVDHSPGFCVEGFRLAWPFALEAALAEADLNEAERLLARVAAAPVGYVPAYLRAQLRRFTALLDAARGREEGVEDGLRSATTALATLAYPYWHARAQLDLAGWLSRTGRDDEAETLRQAALATFDDLGAAPTWRGSHPTPPRVARQPAASLRDPASVN